MKDTLFVLLKRAYKILGVVVSQCEGAFFEELKKSNAECFDFKVLLQACERFHTARYDILEGADMLGKDLRLKDGDQT